MCLNDAFEVPRKIRNRTLGWMLGSRKWLTVTWSGLQCIWYRIFQNMQFKYGAVFLRRKITISSIMQVSYVAIFLGYIKLVWCLLLDFLGSLIHTTGPFCTKKSHFPTGPTQLVQVLYIIELSAKMGIYIVMFAYWRVKVGTWTPVLRYISWMSVLIGESSFSGVKVSVVIFCANLPTSVEYPKNSRYFMDTSFLLMSLPHFSPESSSKSSIYSWIAEIPESIPQKQRILLQFI
jgi:hypothetical protein